MATISVVMCVIFLTQMTGLNMQCPNVNTNIKRAAQDGEDGRITLNILGLFSMNGDYPAGLSYLAAALLAVRHVNERPDILPGYKLKINAYNTKCDESTALDAFFKEIYNPNRTSIMTLGGTCSHVTEATTQVSNIWRLTQISYSAISPHLSDRKIFPNFFRVTTPEQNLTVGRVELFKKFKWKKAHIIYQNFKLFSSLHEYMKNDLKAQNIQVVTAETFNTDMSQDNVQKLKENDARIIIANMYEDKARYLMCAVYNLKGSSDWYKKIVWLLPYFYDRNWMYMDYTTMNKELHNCTADQILDVIGNYFSVGTPSYITDEGYQTVLGISPSKFFQECLKDTLYSSVSDEIPDDLKLFYTSSNVSNGLLYNRRAPEAYDAVWAIAHALNNTLTHLKENNSSRRLEDFKYKDIEFSELVHNGMMKVSFNATSGPFSFNLNGERTTGIEIWQFQRKTMGHDSSITVIGKCNYLLSQEWNCTIDTDKVQWINGSTPVDGVQSKERIFNVDQWIVCVMCTLACLGIMLSIGLLIFNILHKGHRIIKMSSPRLNNIILVGCILGYVTILVLDIEGNKTRVSCVLRTFTIVLSFSLTFGALFAKTWRVYEIFTAGTRVLNSRMLRDSSLFLIVTILVLINCLTLVGWMVASPQRPSNINISTTPAKDNNDIKYTNKFQRCDSDYRLHFTWALVAIQGVVILMGTYLAIQTRKVTFPELNDSKWIALCIYNVVVLGPVGVVVVMATEDKPKINYALEAGMLILTTTITQCLIFVPKIIAYRKHNRSNTSRLDITFKLRNMNEFLGIFTLDPGILNRHENNSTKSENTSTSCQTSQQTDLCDVTCPKHCQSSLKEVKVLEKEEFKPGRNVTHYQDDISVLLRGLNSKQSYMPTTVTSNRKSERSTELNAKIDSVKHFRRSRSESSLKRDSNSNTASNWTEQRPQDFGKVDDQSSSKLKERKSAIVWGNFTFQESNKNGARKHEDSAGLVLDAIKVKADLKVSSTLGLKANWTESRGHLNNTGHICELLSRLKMAVKAGEVTKL